MLVKWVGDWDPDAAKEVMAAAPEWVEFVQYPAGILLMQGKPGNVAQVGPALLGNMGGVVVVVGRVDIRPALVTEFTSAGARRVAPRLGGQEAPRSITRLFDVIRKEDIAHFFGVEIVE